MTTSTKYSLPSDSSFNRRIGPQFAGAGGYTLTEAMVVVVILGVLFLVFVRNAHMTFRTQTRQQALADLQSGALRNLNEFNVIMAKKGGVVPNTQSPRGKSIFADTSSTGDAPWILFFSKDNGTPGQMDAQDEWTVLRFDAAEGRVHEDVFRAAAWTDIVKIDSGGTNFPFQSWTLAASAPAPIRSRVLESSIFNGRIEKLDFNYYASPPGAGTSGNQIRTSLGYQASWVRVNLVVTNRRAGELIKVRKDSWILLKNVVFGRNI